MLAGLVSQGPETYSHPSGETHVDHKVDLPLEPGCMAMVHYSSGGVLTHPYGESFARIVGLWRIVRDAFPWRYPQKYMRN